MVNRTHVLLLGAVVLSGCADTSPKLDDLDDEIVVRLATGDMVAQPADPLQAPVDLNKGFKAAVREALEKNPGYRAAVKLEEEAATSIDVAASGQRPQITGDSTLGAIHEGDPVSDTTAGVAGGLTLSQLIYDGGGTLGSINRATADAVAARAERMDQGNTIAFEAARAWIDVWQYHQRLAWLGTKTSEMDAVVSQIERMASNGMLDRAALDSAKRQIVDISLERATLEGQFDDARSRFERYFGVAPSSVQQPAKIMTGQMARLRAADWKTAPRLRRSAAELVSAKAAQAEAEAAFKPRVSLQTGVMSPMNSDDTTDVTAGFRVEYTFGDGGRRKARLEAATARVDALEARLADEQRDAEAQMRAALDRLTSIEQSMPLLKQKISLSASEAKTARSQIATGQSNLRNLVEAEVENYRARDQEIRMQAELRLLLLEIAARSGTLSKLIGASD